MVIDNSPFNLSKVKPNPVVSLQMFYIFRREQDYKRVATSLLSHFRLILYILLCPQLPYRNKSNSRLGNNIH